MQLVCDTCFKLYELHLSMLLAQPYGNHRCPSCSMPKTVSARGMVLLWTAATMTEDEVRAALPTLTAQMHQRRTNEALRATYAAGQRQVRGQRP